MLTAFARVLGSFGLLLCFVFTVNAQNITVDPVQHLSAIDMRKATPYKFDTGNISKVRVPITNGKPNRQVYRLESCDDANSESICYMVISAANLGGSNIKKAGLNSTDNVTLAAAWTTTQSCGFTYHSAAGVLIARLQQNVTIKYHANAQGQARLSATALGGNLNNTGSWGPLAWWTQTSGPDASPGWGIKVTRSSGGLLNVSSSGILQYWASGSQYVSVILTVDNNGTYCVI